MIFEDLDGDDVAGAFFPALDHLPEGPTAKKLENLRGEKKNENIDLIKIKNCFDKVSFYMPKMLQLFLFPFYEALSAPVQRKKVY